MKQRRCLWWMGLAMGISSLACLLFYVLTMGPNLRLAGTHWGLVAFGNGATRDEVPTDARLSLSFGALPVNIAGVPEDPPVSGAALCNSFSGSYRVAAPSHIRFSHSFLHTQLACITSDLETEHLDAFLKGVHATTGFRFDSKDLILEYGDLGDYLRMRRE